MVKAKKNGGRKVNMRGITITNRCSIKEDMIPANCKAKKIKSKNRQSD